MFISAGRGSRLVVQICGIPECHWEQICGIPECYGTGNRGRCINSSVSRVTPNNSNTLNKSLETCPLAIGLLQTSREFASVGEAGPEAEGTAWLTPFSQTATPPTCHPNRCHSQLPALQLGPLLGVAAAWRGAMRYSPLSLTSPILWVRRAVCWGWHMEGIGISSIVFVIRLLFSLFVCFFLFAAGTCTTCPDDLYRFLCSPGLPPLQQKSSQLSFLNTMLNWYTWTTAVL